MSQAKFVRDKRSFQFAGAITGFCSIWTLACISYDRYNVIVKGVSGQPLTSRKATLMILGCWTLAVAWSIPPFFGWGKYIPEGVCVNKEKFIQNNLLISWLISL